MASSKILDTKKAIVSEITDKLKNSEFLVSVETGTVHIAHEVGCKTICLAGSVAYGRFHPYNDNIIKYVYPEKFNEYIENIRRNNLVYSPPPQYFNVNEINTADVMNILKEYIK